MDLFETDTPGAPAGWEQRRRRNPSSRGPNEARREAHVLPQPFLVAVRRSSRWIIVGATVLDRAQQVLGSDRVLWHVARFVWLLAEVPLEYSSTKYMSCVSKLKADMEMGLRRANTEVGGSVNDHFPEHSAANWRVFHIDDSQAQLFDRAVGAPRSFASTAALARQAGVAAEQVEVLAPHPLDVADAEANAEVDALDVLLGVGHASAVERCPLDKLVATVLSNMQAHSEPNALQGHVMDVERALHRRMPSRTAVVSAHTAARQRAKRTCFETWSQNDYG